MLASLTFIEAFKEDPFFLALAILVSAPGCLAGVIGLALSKRRAAGLALGVVAIACGLIAIGTVVAGTRIGRSHTLAAVSAPGLSPIDRNRIIDYGNLIAEKQLEGGVVISAVPSLLGVVAIVLAIVLARRNAR
jgi:hypothetical protein